MIYQVRRSKVDEIVGKLKKDPTNLYLLQEEFFIDEVLVRKLVLDSLKIFFKVCDSNTHLGEEVDTAENHVRIFHLSFEHKKQCVNLQKMNSKITSTYFLF